MNQASQYCANPQFKFIIFSGILLQNDILFEKEL